jgi:hypothetical protein
MICPGSELGRRIGITSNTKQPLRADLLKCRSEHKEEGKMKSKIFRNGMSLLAGAVMLLSGASTGNAASVPDTTVPVTMTVTVNVDSGKRMPAITRDDIVVRQGKDRLQVTDWVPAQGDRAGLELFILIDDTADSRLALQYADLQSFIKDQPPSTLIGVGYMRNGTVQIAQDLTSNHALAAQALRMPVGTPGAYGSPYLSVTDLMKRWPVDQNRREVLMFTSGIGRGNGLRHLTWRMGFRLDPDVYTATAVAQRTGTNIFTIYTPGSAHFRYNQWDLMNGQMNLSRLSESTGAASFYLGVHSPVSIQPYLAELQKVLNNQYRLSFSARPGNKAGLQSIKLSTEVAGVDLSAYDSVWVGAAK